MTNAIVLGGTAGVGRAVVDALVARGMTVGVVARGQDRLDQLRSDHLVGRIQTASADVGDAAELVAAEKGAGMMIMVASKFQNTDIVILGIILIGIIGFGIDMLMRWAERALVPWKGKG